MSAWEDLKRATKSSTDQWIGGVCGGLGSATPIPTWMWRAAFITGTFLWGAGLIFYITLWICMPKSQGTPVVSDGGPTTPAGT